MKIIKSQDGGQIHVFGANIPCYINIAEVVVDGEKENTKTTLYSVGINNASFALYKKKETAQKALEDIENFLCDKHAKFKLPLDS